MRSETMPARRSTRKCRLNAGRVRAMRSAISLGRQLRLRSSSTTRRRVGSARAARVRSRLLSTGLSIPHALHEPPAVAFEILGLVRAVGPVFLPVVGCLGLAHDLGALGARALAVRVGVLDRDAQALRVGAAQRARALAMRARPIRLAPGLGDHDHAVFPEFELRMLDASAFALDLDAHAEAEDAA